MQLNPREYFTIVRQIEDHTDSTTYYVRAVIRNAKTDAIISVNGNSYINLTDQGNRRFSSPWLVPADPSGQGFYVSVLTTVYTDSGYTTKSPNYGEKIDIYLIQDRHAQLHGGGSDIDYKRIQKMIDSSLDRAESTRKPPKEIVFPKIDIVGPIADLRSSLISTLVPKIDGIKIPEMKDVEPVITRIANNNADDMKDMEERLLDRILAAEEKSGGEIAGLKKAVESVATSCERLGSLVEKNLNSLKTRFDDMTVDVNFTGLMGKVVSPDKKPDSPVKDEIKDDRVSRIIKSRV